MRLSVNVLIYFPLYEYLHNMSQNYELNQTSILWIYKFSLLWGEAQLCLPYDCL